jgi:membrane associated rhomboid family serine protease
MENKIKFWSLWLCLICLIVFFIQVIIPGFTETFFLSEDALIKPWQFITAVFLHGDIAHLLYNLFALFFFGIVLEKTIGSRRFFGFFILSGFFANIISFFWFPNALGASGAIMALIGCLAVLEPMMTIWAFNLPMPMFVAALLWIGGNVLGIFGIGDQGIGYLAHLSGIAIGLVYGFYLRLFVAKKIIVTDKREEPLISEDYVRFWEDRHLKK